MSPGDETAGAAPSATARRPPAWMPAAAVAVWFVLWYFTPGLHDRGVGSLLTQGGSADVLVESLVALGLLGPLLLLHRRWRAELLPVSRQTLVLLVPAVLAIVLPLHYDLGLPVAVYIAWMTVSVFWQDYLTFGLLQNHLAARLPTWAVIPLVTAIFTLGHILLLPQRFGLQQLPATLGILAMGLVFSSLRAGLRSLHPLLALHLSFYFVFA